MKKEFTGKIEGNSLVLLAKKQGKEKNHPANDGCIGMLQATW